MTLSPQCHIHIAIMFHLNKKIIILLQILNFISAKDDNRLPEFQRFCLEVHNLLRLMFGAPPLKWDNTLSERAQAWAMYLSNRQDTEYDASSKYGDSVYSTDHLDNVQFLCLDAFRKWQNELKHYQKNPDSNLIFPEALKISPKNETKRFTQMIWASSEKIGIGDAGTAIRKHYLVASYFPPGNDERQFKKNVFQFRRIPISCVWTVCVLANPGNDISSILSRRFHNKTITEAFLNEKETFVLNHTEPCHVPTRPDLLGSNFTKEMVFRDEGIPQDWEKMLTLLQQKTKVNPNVFRQMTKTTRFKRRNTVKSAEAKPLLHRCGRQVNTSDLSRPKTQNNGVQCIPKTGTSTIEIPSRIILVPVPEPASQPVQPLPPVPPKKPKAQEKPGNPVLAVICASPAHCARSSIPVPKTAQSGINQHQDDRNNEYRFL